MNSLQFIGHSYPRDPQGNVVIEDIINYFDHSMAAYESIKIYSDIKDMNGYVDHARSSIEIVANLEEDKVLEIINDIDNILNNNIHLYNHTFYISSTPVGDSCIKMSITKIN